ncbi:MAG: hypothetical protein QOJ92_2703 [Frankiales bacterium]|nr:hypothetical protein [Frankiales bacterium]
MSSTASSSDALSSTRVSRRIVADPTSVALLLADPATVELWPRLHRSAASLQRDGDVGLVTIEVGSSLGELRLRPPSRTPTAFVLRFDVDCGIASSGPVAGATQRVEGRLVLSLVSPGAGAPATEAVLDLTADRDLAEDAAEFLGRVARAAEQRARAA